MCIRDRCTHAIDLHTAAVNRDNLPQMRADLSSPAVKKLAMGFSIPVIINSRLIDKSLRAEAAEIGIPVVTYEAGEALRFSEQAIVTGGYAVSPTPYVASECCAAESLKPQLRNQR